MSTSSRARNASVPNTRRIGWAKLPAVYWVRGLGSGKPQSQAGARRTARGEAVDDEGGGAAENAMNRSTIKPL